MTDLDQALRETIRKIVREEVEAALADIDAIADAVAKRLRSGPTSSIEISDREGNTRWQNENESMDPIHTETNGASSSSEPTANELLARIRALPPRKKRSMTSVRRRMRAR